MEKEFVTYEQALALSDLGFKQQNYFAFYHKGRLSFENLFRYDSIKENPRNVDAPLKQQVFRWFRENHGWIGGIRQLSQSGNGMIIGEFRKDEDNSFMMFAETYEQCENYCIENLIKMIKQQDNE